MSGGAFSYIQYRINDAADELYKYLERCKSDEVDEFGWKPEHPPEIIQKFEETERMLRVCSIYLQRVDWLISGDDGDDDFIPRLKEDLEELEKELNERTR